MSDIRKELERNLQASAQKKIEQSPEKLPTEEIADVPSETVVEETIVVEQKFDDEIP